ncbi:hypothetical protein V6U89_27250, partial [Micromonospora sp. CPCC 206171]
TQRSVTQVLIPMCHAGPETGQLWRFERLIVIDMNLKILTSLCARLYGRGAAANRARRAVEAVTTPDAQA